jgi:glycosyltransferase involved in cell wall biosynthesis
LLPGIDVVAVPGCGAGKRLRQLATVFSRQSWEYGRYRREAMRETLGRLVAERQPDVVHLDDLGVAQFGRFGDAANVYSAHNVEYRILERTVEASRGVRRRFARAELGKVEPLERHVWTTMDLSLACSEIDAADMRAGGATVLVCPNGADPVELLDPPLRRPEDPLRLLFVGAVNYRPNRLGLEWFINEVLPVVRGRLPVPVEVDVVGMPPRKLTGSESVTVHGRVPSLDSFYERAHVVIVPVLYGSGTRLKVVEAMAYGRPVVSTAAGAEGLPIVPERHYLEADEPKAFADAVLILARMCESWEGIANMLRLARGAIEPLLWPHVVDELCGAYLGFAARRALERA